MSRTGGTLSRDEIDAIIESSQDEVGQYLHLAGGNSYSTGNRLSDYATIYPESGVAVLDLIGPIHPRANSMTSSGATSLQKFAGEFLRLEANDDVTGIVLNVDSPGGDVRGLGDTANMIARVAKESKKPIKAFGFGYVASAAYYLASAVGPKNLYASKSALVGSIGTVLTGKKDDDGTFEIVSSISPKKRVDADTDEGRAVLQQRVDDLANIFVEDVAGFRGVASQKVLDDYGQGDVLVGTRSLTNGLIDGVSTLSEVVKLTADEVRKGHSATGYRGRASSEVATLLSFTHEDINDMGLRDKILNLLNRTEEEGTDDAAQASAATGSNEVAGAEGLIADEAPTFTREELEDQYSDAAELFASRLVTGSRLLPAQESHAVMEMVNAKIDDTLFGGQVTFIRNNEIVSGTREEAVTARYEAAPKHGLTEKAVKAVKEGSASASVLKEQDADSDSAPVSADRKAELLSKTPAGRHVLSQTNGNGK